MPCAAGLQAWRGRLAERDASCVARLKAAGATVVGKTLMDEAAFGALGDNPWFGRCENPARPGYTAGGSSAGSAAAVAAGLADLALGTDTLGSVRIPASYCGVVGYVPGAGLVPMDGVAPLAPSFDRVGFFARTTAELLPFLPAFASSSAPRSTSLLVQHPRLKQAAAILGARPVDAGGFDWRALRRAMLLMVEREAAAAIRVPAETLSERVRAALHFGRDADTERVQRARETMDAARQQIEAWLGNADLLLLPATPHSAFPLDAPAPAEQADYATLSSLLGLPAISVPARVPEGELPFGIQLIARPGQDAMLLRAAALLA
jgi:aspartyl-tRNA(Asn)/glutamyl-tRNA(Gln) amidotransferase subunit A